MSDPEEDDAPFSEPTEPTCASCGRPIGWDGRPASVEGDALICGECDAARNFDALFR